MNRFIGCFGIALGLAIVPLKVARADDPPRLNIVVVDGGPINNIKQRTSRETIQAIEVDVFFMQLTPGVFLVCDVNEDDDGIVPDSCNLESVFDNEETDFEWDTSLMD